MFKNRYADAFLDLAKNDKNVHVLQCIEQVEALLESDDVQKFFNNPFVENNHKYDVINEMGSHYQLPIIFINFLKTIIDADRFGDIASIFDAVKQKFYADNESAPVRVVSAIDLTDDQKNKIAKWVAGKFSKKPILSYEINTDILSGFVLYIGSQMIDLSFKSNLSNIKNLIKRV